MKLKKVVQLHKTYREGKEQAFEESVNAFETGPRLYFLAFLGFTLVLWGTAYGLPFGLEEVYDRFGTVPILIILATSYFSAYTASKFIFTVTAEELEDSTSAFAIFSACQRKERRGLFSVVFALIHTTAFVLYLIHKDTGWLAFP